MCIIVELKKEQGEKKDSKLIIEPNGNRERSCGRGEGPISGNGPMKGRWRCTEEVLPGERRYRENADMSRETECSMTIKGVKRGDLPPGREVQGIGPGAKHVFLIRRQVMSAPR